MDSGLPIQRDPWNTDVSQLKFPPGLQEDKEIRMAGHSAPFGSFWLVMPCSFNMEGLRVFISVWFRLWPERSLWQILAPLSRCVGRADFPGSLFTTCASRNLASILFYFSIFIYLAALGPSCGTKYLCYLVGDPSVWLWHAGSLASWRVGS